MGEVLNEFTLSNLKIKLNKKGLLELEKDEIELISNNKEYFPDFAHFAKGLIEKWDEHLEKKKIREEMFNELNLTPENVKKIIND